MNENASGSLPFESPDEKTHSSREENARLRTGPGGPRHSDSTAIASESPSGQDRGSTTQSKEERARKRIALFRGLFRGREDVYARRWENADGRSGYMPAAVKDWRAINRSRPEERKKVDQKTRRFLPLTDAIIENHLLGKETIGVYPLPARGNVLVSRGRLR